ncbi:hypothetical protein C7M84_006427 [Penaeus vannamei]|uniref:Uncharacterized protein n=1 Tax=Penaeus vannamei TaxID=6689 RepID=A0A423TF50_PENVA|nr:hypothetical protein C7M84_006427 [Penaeus vannamei]
MTEPRRISRVGLLDPPPDEGPRSLDAALLLRNLLPRPPQAPLGGFDNVGFDLESFGEATRPGSRRPFVSVHVRTLPPEEHVRSTLSRQPKSLPPTPILNGLGGRRAASSSPFLQQNGLGGQWRHHTGSVRVIHIHDDDEAPARKTAPSPAQKTVSGWEVCGPAVSADVSVRETMVEAGGAMRPSAANSVSVAAHSRVPMSARVSRVPLLSGVASATMSSSSNNNSNSVTSVVLCGPPATTTTAVAAPTVSALTKVSSVRIVPTPTPTPTPSIISGHEPQQHQAQQGGSSRASGPSAAPRPAPRPPKPSPPRPTGEGAGEHQRLEARRRERRERRAHRSGVAAPPPPQPGQTDVGGGGGGVGGDTTSPPAAVHDAHLPDLLHSHVPPPYSTLPSGVRPPMGGLLGPPPPPGPHWAASAAPPPMPFTCPLPAPGTPHRACLPGPCSRLAHQTAARQPLALLRIQKVSTRPQEAHRAHC